jgi:hypothetical protein
MLDGLVSTHFYYAECRSPSFSYFFITVLTKYFSKDYEVVNGTNVVDLCVRPCQSVHLSLIYASH